jgi:hypothetical protein
MTSVPHALWLAAPAALLTIAVLGAAGADTTAQTAPPRPASPQTRDMTQPPATGTGVIAGTVVTDDADARPVARAMVSLSTPNNPFGRITLTNAEGQFVFADLPAGRYGRLSVSKPGYIATYYGAKRPGYFAQGIALALAEGERLTNLNLRLTRGSVITGTVTDESGRPQPNAQVLASTVTIVDGLRVTNRSFVMYANTDDLGAYRAYGLPEGEYVISATVGGISARVPVHLTTKEEVQWAERLARGSPATAPAGSPAVSPPLGQTVTYSPTYHPATPDLQSATIITLGRAEERADVNLTIRFVPTAKVEGVLLTVDGRPASGGEIRLLSQTPATGMLAMELGMFTVVRSDAAGRFSFGGVTPGRYAVTARAASGAAGTVPAPAPPAGRGAAPQLDLWASDDVTVDGRDVAGLSLRLGPGMTVSGRVVFPESSLPPPPDLTRVQVRLMMPATGATRLGVSPAPVRADGTFTFTGVLPGTYRVVAMVLGQLPPSMTGRPSWTPRSATLDGRDVMDQPLDVRPGDAIDDLVVSFTDRVTEVAGSLVDAAGRPAPEFFVMIFSTDRRAWFQGSRRLLPQPIRPDTAGRFTATTLPPGEYYLCALTDFSPVDTYSPSFLDQLVPSSIKVTLVEGQKTTQDLKLAGG